MGSIVIWHAVSRAVTTVSPSVRRIKEIVPRAGLRDRGGDRDGRQDRALIYFQPTGGGRAAIMGDFVMTAAEVNPVIRALRDKGIEVTALDSHLLGEQPRLVFMHFWANDDAVNLARGCAPHSRG
ncbi:MAG TPA: DUF1259 domain-containing protein [Longimicrobium sp.]